MDAWHAVILALAALLVGAFLPALLQLTLAVRSWRSTAERTGSAMVAIEATAERVDRLTSRLEEGGRVERLLEAVDSLAGAATRAQETLRVVTAVGAALGPAMGAAVRAWRESRPAEAGTNGGAPQAGDPS